MNVIDRSALEEAIAEAEALSADDYTEQSWAAMQEKLEAAREVLDDVIATDVRSLGSLSGTQRCSGCTCG